MKNTKMFYNHITENNTHVYNKLIKQIKDILVNKYGVSDQTKLEYAIGHTIEKTIKYKIEKNKEAVSDKVIRKNIKYSVLKLFNLDIKAGLVREDLDSNGEVKRDEKGNKIYIREYKVVNVDQEDDNKSVIENINTGDSSQTNLNKLDVFFIVKLLRDRFDDLTGIVFYKQYEGYKNKEIAELLDVKVTKIENIKSRTKEYLNANRELFE